MIIKNTSRYPTSEVRKLIRFAMKGIPENKRLEVHVKNSKYGFRGYFYPRVPYIANTKYDRSFLITIGIGAEDKFPISWNYPGHHRCRKYACTIQNWKEALVHTAAHESEHLRQHMKGKGLREDHAERRAYKTLMKYRNRR